MSYDMTKMLGYVLRFLLSEIQWIVLKASNGEDTLLVLKTKDFLPPFYIFLIILEIMFCCLNGRFWFGYWVAKVRELVVKNFKTIKRLLC